MHRARPVESAVRKALGIVAATVVAIVGPSAAQAGTILKRDGFAGIARGQVILMPSPVQEFEITAGGPQPRADWSAAAVEILQKALVAELSARGLTTAVYHDPEDPEERATHQQIIKVHNIVTQTIQQYRFTPNQELPSKRGRLDWGLGAAVTPLRADDDLATHALFVEFVEGHSSGGRVALNVIGAVLGGSVVYGRQTGVASLVDLSTGDVMWFSRRVADAGGDLRTPEGARNAVRDLLEGLTQ